MTYDINGNNINTVYSKNGLSITPAYDINGNPLGTSHVVTADFTSTLLYDIPDIGGGTQGLACDSISQEIAQLYSGKIITIDLSDGSYTQRASTRNLGHGSAGKFESTKRSQSDLYPALWVSTGRTQTFNNVVYGQYLEVFVGESQSTINRAFFVPLDQSGYSLFAFDLDNNIVYSVVLSSYEAVSGSSGWCSIKAYDMTDITAFTDVDYYQTPANGCWLVNNVLDSFTTDYVAEVQSLTYYDGLILLLSDVGGVVCIDTETHGVYFTITDGIVPYEREGIDFILNPSTQKMDMVLSARQTTFNVYYRYQFN